MFSGCYKHFSLFILPFMTLQTIFFGKVDSADSEILGIVAESCRFELHTSKLPWDKAYQACKQRGLTLMSLADETDESSMFTFVERAANIHKMSELTQGSYWVGLRMESQAGSSPEYQWGNCVPDPSATKTFECLSSYSGTKGCGFMDLMSKEIKLTRCSTVEAMGFMCEHPARSDSCFTKMSVPLQSMGYDNAESATSRDCAISCLSDEDCAGIHISLETSCTTLEYDNDMESSLPGSIFNSTYIYHRKYIYHSHYYGFIPGLSEEELCSLPIGSPIITTTIAGETTTETINPTSTEKTTYGAQTSDSTSESTTTDGEQTSDSTSETTTTDGEQTSDSTSETTTDDGTQTSDSTSETTTDDGTQTSDSTSESTTIDGEQTSDSTSESTTTDDGTQTTELTSETAPNALQSNTSMSNRYVYNFSSCVCVCTETNQTLEDKIENIVSKLRLETSTLSSTVRKKTCAEDLRLSAKNVGLIGVVILCVIAAILLCFDALRCTEAIFKKKNLKGTNMYKKGKRVNR